MQKKIKRASQRHIDDNETNESNNNEMMRGVSEKKKNKMDKTVEKMHKLFQYHLMVSACLYCFKMINGLGNYVKINHMTNIHEVSQFLF